MSSVTNATRPSAQMVAPVLVIPAMPEELARAWSECAVLILARTGSIDPYSDSRDCAEAEAQFRGFPYLHEEAA